MDRRAFLLITTGVAAGFAVDARANPSEMQEAIRKLTRGAPINPGKVTLELPPLSENGHVVPMRVAVTSPMTQADHVRAIHVFTEKNPQPYVASFRIGPRAGRAAVNTRVRLADTQSVTAIAEMSDGSFWTASAQVVVTLAACLEELT
jgi:sulfur-oxidizing protein SoxY